MKQITFKVDQLRHQLSGLNLYGENAISQIETALQLIRTTTISIESRIDQNHFKSLEDEIHFYRHIKPSLYSLQLAFQNILKIELLRPAYDKKKFKCLVKQKLDFIQAHFLDYPEFTRYYNSTATNDDERYFLRSNKIQLDCFPLLYDNKFSTGYDLIATYLLVYQFLIEHFKLGEKKIQIENLSSNVSWAGDKVAYVELLSGLHLMSSVNIANMGKMDLKTLNSKLCHFFNIDVKDVYGKRIEIRNRKGERFKYLRKMLKELERHFDENFD